jgi:vesicular inhibitory amino acid transporter
VPAMLYISYAVVTLAYCAMAAVGYLHYGERVQQQVTMSFQPGLGTTIVTWLIVVNGVTKFVLTLAPLAMGMEELTASCVESPWGQWLLGSLLRVLSVFLAYVVASKVTFFAYVASFIGALMSMLVSVIFPSMCYLKIFAGELGWGTRLWNWLVILSGVVAATGGTYAAIVGVAGG